MKITFSDNSKLFVLSAFGKSINEEGFIIDDLTKELVLTIEGKSLHIDDFVGINKELGLLDKKFDNHIILRS